MFFDILHPQVILFDYKLFLQFFIGLWFLDFLDIESDGSFWESDWEIEIRDFEVIRDEILLALVIEIFAHVYDLVLNILFGLFVEFPELFELR